MGIDEVQKGLIPILNNKAKNNIKRQIILYIFILYKYENVNIRMHFS